MSVPFSSPLRWPARASTALVWALAIGTVVFWGLRIASPSDAGTPPPVNSAPAITVDPSAVAQALGAVTSAPVAAPTPNAASRFALMGVVADDERQGAALIAVDGKPARPFRVGAMVADGYVLQAVSTRAAALGTDANGDAAFTLRLPERQFAGGAAEPVPFNAAPPPSQSFLGPQTPGKRSPLQPAPNFRVPEQR